MNLPLALNAALMKDAMEMDELAAVLMAEARDGIAEFKVEVTESEDEI